MVGYEVAQAPPSPKRRELDMRLKAALTDHQVRETEYFIPVSRRGDDLSDDYIFGVEIERAEKKVYILKYNPSFREFYRVQRPPAEVIELLRGRVPDVVVEAVERITEGWPSPRPQRRRAAEKLEKLRQNLNEILDVFMSFDCFLWTGDYDYPGYEIRADSPVPLEKLRELIPNADGPFPDPEAEGLWELLIDRDIAEELAKHIPRDAQDGLWLG